MSPEFHRLAIFASQSQRRDKRADPLQRLAQLFKAGGVGVTDPDSEMIRNAEIQFENHNVQFLTKNEAEGVEAYKRLHRIKDDYADRTIVRPYKKTTELVGQIQNLKQIPSGAGISERRIVKTIQRDSWSALKYALRFAQKLERTYLVKQERKSDWTREIAKFKNGQTAFTSTNGKKSPTGRLITRRTGGRHFG